MQRQSNSWFLVRLVVAGLAVVLISNAAAQAEGRWPASRTSAATNAPNAATVRVCGGSGQTFNESTSPLVETISVSGLPASAFVTHLSVDLNIQHSWSGDVVAVLGHDATSVTLIDRPGTTNTAYNCNCGCPYDNLAGTFSDSATGDADRCVLGTGGLDPANGPYKPVGPGALADFTGSNPNGAWTLTLQDQADNEGGSLPANGVCLDISYEVPLAAGLANLAAVRQGDTVTLTWETVDELDIAGFNVWRSTSPGAPQQQMNATLIPAQNPGSSLGAAYQWNDTAAPQTAVYYWVQQVDLAGSAVWHGPVVP